MNIPIPISFDGKDFSEAHENYCKGMAEIFAIAEKNGVKKRVHTIQIIPSSKITIVVFIDNDDFADTREKAMGMVDQYLKRGNAELCEHEWGKDLKCIHCGTKM